MTRINVVQPIELCDQHLLAENMEIIRIPNYVIKKFGLVKISKVSQYILGKGHVIFFRDKLLFLYKRYMFLQRECINRGFKVNFRWPKSVIQYVSLWKDYKVTKYDIEKNRIRIYEKMPPKPRFSNILKRKNFSLKFFQKS
ncbi:pyrimidine dimer DNA glycosylase/endonuclease V [Candidatus Riesia pediculicola]|uniref:pyrimidine dimer DNA glycosylase/endonuclease V n=1 Tax=Candidatus Riesia pediculicola TaxID=401619 RepID=UPI0009C29FB4|nr:pyrimidine dimer DNA glycosylase/endonuclease V [Candidatus Riesia pediculicola]ARC54399.1 hypothetical protein AOE57_02350 [Candidatus Riesia pediculicola]